jgi:16S rRNA (guanine966-N2)-methyltransferase
MRVTSGIFRGRKLLVPEGRDVRPTSDKVRQAVFNILLKYGLPDGVTVLDGFCGTGALGIEALSRGAAQGIFMDSSRESLDCCRGNIEALGVEDKTLILKRDMLKPGARPAEAAPSELAFLDPPYRQHLMQPSLAALAENNWLATGAICVTESERQAADDIPDGFALEDDRIYGSSRIRIFKYS